ncbi:hypothetical protein AQJ64_17890 [Streptomyces griseoruber]|uniref:Uncharacterized protein n=1 Tax=Streptomyces griseoruber TaxID=1943 RepID=A0A101T041_9ACTN|nr:hypothetical protein [Streptomyces griseoruber]KUN83334.1 hypothetical protein AQJ64_17890 [Streptomyces griseoruber]
MTYPASREARKPTAAHIPQAAPNLPSGIPTAGSALLPSGTEATNRVSAPGEIALTVTPNRAGSLAAVLVNPRIPALAVA